MTRINDIRRALDDGRPVVSDDLRVVHAQIDGRMVRFCSNLKADPIQRANRQGRFYEARELALLRPLLPKGGTFVDIGANVGNHSLYAALVLGAGKVIPFEPNPLAYELLVANVLLNDLLDVVDLSHVGLGLSDQEAGGFGMEDRSRNLGAAKMQAGAGDLQVIRGDAALSDVTPDFIKIDVEGMEIQALKGLSGVFERCRPHMLIEVDNENIPAFETWMAQNGYGTLMTHRRYRSNVNYIVTDAAQLSALAPQFAHVEEGQSDVA